MPVLLYTDNEYIFYNLKDTRFDLNVDKKDKLKAKILWLYED